MSTTPSKTALALGWILTALLGALLLLDGAMKIAQPDFVLKATTELGYPQSTILPIGIALIASVLLYLFPPTAILGAILVTAYFGGAVASHVRHGDPLYTHILAPVYFAIVLWIAILLREPRLRTLLPFRFK